MKLDFPEQRKKVFSTVLPMRWGDMDAYGHLNNATYLRFFEEARIQWITAGGRPMVADNQGPVVANIFCNYLRQLEYPANLRVTLYVTLPGRTSCDCWMTVEREDQPGVIYANGGTTMVWIDLLKQRPIPLPQWLLDLIGQEMPEAGR